MEVVKLPYCGDPSQCHLGEGGSGQRKVGVGVQLSRNGIHPFAPGPEGATVIMGPPPKRAVESVAVSVGKPGQNHPGQYLSITGHCPRSHRAEPAAGYLERHVMTEAARQHCVCSPPPLDVRHVKRPAHRASSSVTAVRASTPPWQSWRSANSAGECEIPLGLRTNNMALDNPAVARTPQS